MGKEWTAKSLGDIEKQKKMKLLKSQLLAKKASLLKQMQEEESSDSSDSTSSESDSGWALAQKIL